jgi:hypothetical protein
MSAGGCDRTTFFYHNKLRDNAEGYYSHGSHKNTAWRFGVISRDADKFLGIKPIFL